MAAGKASLVAVSVRLILKKKHLLRALVCPYVDNTTKRGELLKLSRRTFHDSHKKDSVNT